MKSGLLFRLLLGAALPLAASAATVVWDPAGDGTGSGGAGTWDTSTAVWYNAVDAAWVNANNDIAVFNGTGGAVALGEAITAGGLTFNNTGYTVSGTGPLTLAGTTPTITVTNSSDTATISSAIAGSAGLVKAGAGNLILTVASTYTGGTTLSGGTLTLGAANTISTSGALSVTCLLYTSPSPRDRG